MRCPKCQGIVVSRPDKHMQDVEYYCKGCETKWVDRELKEEIE